MRQLLIFLFLTISSTTWTQQNFNKHNPYVTNSEIHWLRQQQINLFNAPIVDDEFTQNVRKTIDYRNDYNQKTSKYATSLTASSLLLIIGTVGLINNAVTQNPNVPNGPGVGGADPQPTDLKSIFILSGVVGAINSIFTIKFYKQRKAARSLRDQQIEITRNQYNILSGG